MPLPFEFVVGGPPVSQQARRRERVHEWKREVRRVAETTWPIEELPIARPIMITITYFFTTPGMDVDNIPKPIVDALEGLVYLDDDQVTDVLCRKRDLNKNLRITNPSSTAAEGFDRGGEFLHVVVRPAPDQEVIS